LHDRKTPSPSLAASLIRRCGGAGGSVGGSTPASASRRSLRASFTARLRRFTLLTTFLRNLCNSSRVTVSSWAGCLPRSPGPASDELGGRFAPCSKHSPVSQATHPSIGGIWSFLFQ
jgi:hypothetical protein